MSDADILIRGMLVGLTVAVPVGPMAVLVIRKVLLWGCHAGMAFGSGIALADATYAAIAAGGFAGIESVVERHAAAIRYIGGMVLIGLGLAIVRSAGRFEANQSTGVPWTSRLAEAAKAYGLTLSNPTTILVFLALIAGFGTTFADARSAIPLFVTGVFVSSFGWWVALSVATSLVGKKVTARSLKRLNVAAGMVIALFGVGAIAATLY